MRLLKALKSYFTGSQKSTKRGARCQLQHEMHLRALIKLLMNVHCSANCRLELNYGMEVKVDMVPLMMQPNFKPKGWRKSQRSALRLSLLQHRHAADMKCASAS